MHVAPCDNETHFGASQHESTTHTEFDGEHEEQSGTSSHQKSAAQKPEPLDALKQKQSGLDEHVVV